MEDGTIGYSEGVDALQEKQVVRTEIYYRISIWDRQKEIY